MTGILVNGKVCHFPRVGTLIVSSDLHGNFDDFQRLEGIFNEKLEKSSDAYLLFLGDLIHGPSYAPEDWPDHLGSYYKDQSGSVMDGFLRLQNDFPGRIASLLGNHEHGHVGGPRTKKFCRDRYDDEVDYFEQSVGKKKTGYCNELFAKFPLVATTHAGVIFAHAAPNVQHDTSLEQIAALDYKGFEKADISDMYDVDPLGTLLWCRYATPEAAERFLRTLSTPERCFSVVVYGHDPVNAGFEKIHPSQLNLSTSFKMQNKNKTYLQLDLSKDYSSVDDFHPGQELKLLYL